MLTNIKSQIETLSKLCQIEPLDLVKAKAFNDYLSKAKLLEKVERQFLKVTREFFEKIEELFSKISKVMEKLQSIVKEQKEMNTQDVELREKHRPREEEPTTTVKIVSRMSFNKS